MAGSIKWFVYTADRGDLFGYLQDESNSEVFGTAHDANLGLPTWGYPSNLEMRTAHYKSTTTVRTRKIVVPTRALYDDLAGGGTAVGSSFTDAATGETFVLQYLSPERVRPVIIAEDTGLNDGDPS